MDSLDSLSPAEISSGSKRNRSTNRTYSTTAFFGSDSSLDFVNNDLSNQLLNCSLSEERVKVDRRKFEQMLNGDDPELGNVDEFFKRVMVDTKTDITWPSKLKSTKSKKDPHIRICGDQADVSLAKDRILAILDTRRNRITLKMDVAFTDHSHIIGKGGKSIQKVMDETGCHIHFPDSNRTSVIEKSNQVSIAGSAVGAEIARSRIRDLLPFTVFFDLPFCVVQAKILDPSSPIIQQIQQNYGVTVNIRYNARTTKPAQQQYFGNQGNGVLTVTVRGLASGWFAFGLKQGLIAIIEYLTASTVHLSSVTLSLTIEISAQHHSFVMGRGNILAIMQKTGAIISFPDPITRLVEGASVPTASNSPARQSTVAIQGLGFDSIHLAWQELLGSLPLVLIFDLREGQELDVARVNQFVECMNISISVKPKFKNNSKTVMIRAPEKNSRFLFEVRRQLLGLDESEVPAPSNFSQSNENSFLTSKLRQMFLPVQTGSLIKPAPAPIPATPLSLGLSQFKKSNCFPMKNIGMELQTLIGSNPLLVQALINQQAALPSSPKFENQAAGQLPTQSDFMKQFQKHFANASSPGACASVSSDSSNTPPTPPTKTFNILPNNCSAMATNPLSSSLNLSVTTSTKSSNSSTFGWPEAKLDHEERRGLAMKAIRTPVEGERTPTSIWSGYGFSKTIPDTVMKSKLWSSFDSDDATFKLNSDLNSNIPIQTSTSFWSQHFRDLETQSEKSPRKSIESACDLEGSGGTFEAAPGFEWSKTKRPSS